MSLSDDIKALRVQHSIPFLLREPLSRVLDALEKRTEAFSKFIELVDEQLLLDEELVTAWDVLYGGVKEARAALEE